MQRCARLLASVCRLPLSVSGSLTRPSIRAVCLSTTAMAKSKYEYVRHFELDDRCLPNSWIVVRIDGKGFHRFTNEHSFEKPNDAPALELMTRAARDVVDLFRPDLVLAYGQSDEYSFVFRRQTTVYRRRASKLMSQVVSQFSSSYVFHWPSVMGARALRQPPTFDGRVVLYPTDRNLRDYLSWRQADCHINNPLQHGLLGAGQPRRSHQRSGTAEERLRHTLAADKNEILFSEFGINYNDEPALYRKGTVIVRSLETPGEQDSKLSSDTGAPDGSTVPASEGARTDQKPVGVVKVLNCDIIGDEFWNEHSSVLSGNNKKAK
ncbi:putative tRNA(His) guanylyltransferase [Amphibalanus amphitrite]|uniref:tRNA(His) guanylyltransferase n=1 Tax=Amphibalanus amphitrite TaxID=1232801 RepID=A0A6A4W131_AMPAM|nr:putative tRNA(His) guanylyltransferase [Amphibalanus amphitrite]KAF0299633.1 putative tRNA(His) guanylyltransferase [Amphibalanus amphitrite]